MSITKKVKISPTNLLNGLVRNGKIRLDDVVTPEKQEAAMKNLLDGVHPYKITEPKEGNKDHRWSTYVADPSKADGRRKVFRNSKSELYAFLIQHYGLAIGTTLTFGEVFEQFVVYKELYTTGVTNAKKSKSPSTIARYRRDYQKTLKNTVLDTTPINEVTNILVEQVMAEAADKLKLSESYVSNLIGYVRGALDFAYKKKLIPANEGVCIDRDAILCHSIPPKPYEDEERVLNEDEVIALYEATKKHIKAHPAYMPNYGILLALMTGMRAGEIAALKWSDVDDLYIHIRHSEHRVDYTSHKDALEHYDGLVNMYEWIEPKEYFANHNARSIMVVGEPKCRKHRDFPVVPQIRALFAEIRALGTTSKDDFIFVRKDGKRHSGHDISCALERRSIEAGIKKASIHMLRRTFSSNAQTQHPRELVASLLGHLEKTNAQHYDYDTSTYEYKKNMVSSMYSNVLKMPS